MILFTADTHFNHANIIKYCNRPFSSLDEMNKVLVENWNSTVSDKDTIYHLGDFGFGDTSYIQRGLDIIKLIRQFTGLLGKNEDAIERVK